MEICKLECYLNFLKHIYINLSFICGCMYIVNHALMYYLYVPVITNQVYGTLAITCI